MDYILTAIVPLLLACIIFLKSKKTANQDGFMKKIMQQYLKERVV